MLREIASCTPATDHIHSSSGTMGARFLSALCVRRLLGTLIVGSLTPLWLKSHSRLLTWSHVAPYAQVSPHALSSLSQPRPWPVVSRPTSLEEWWTLRILRQAAR